MAKITVFNVVENLDYIQVGEVINFRKDAFDLDEFRIKAYYQGNEIGMVGAALGNILPGTSLNKDIWEQVDDEFSGIVTKLGTVASLTNKAVLEVEIQGTNAAAGNTASAGNKVFNFTVSGSSTKYPGKTSVITEVNSGRRVFLQLKKEQDNKGNEIIVVYRVVNGSNENCGKIDESKLGLNGNSAKDDYELLKSILDSESIEGVVFNTLPTSYTISVTVANDAVTQFKNVATKKAITSVKQKLIDDGWDETTLDEIEEYLLSQNFTSEMIQNIFKSYKMYPDEVKFRIRKPDVLYQDSKETYALEICYAAFCNSYHLLLTGDKGTGKNCLIRTWAWVLQRPLYEESINRDTDKIDILGGKTIETEVQDGVAVSSVEFDPEVLLQAMEVGGIMNIDEINFADAGITGVIHSICDDRREIQVPGYKKVAADDNFFIMATMNIDYQGTNELNEALQDRFVDIMFESNESIASILMKNCPKAPQSEIQIADSIYRQMYSIIQNRDSQLDSKNLTVRGFIQALKMSPMLGLKKALITCVANKVKDSEYRENVATIINSKCK